MNARRPPVIPEIAKAYQNDPRTVLAMQAMKAGGSTAPVAVGQYGMADGIARVLQGIGGAYMDKETQERYGDDEAKLLAQRQQRGVDGMTGVAPLAPPVAPIPAAPAVAAALGAPPPPAAPAMAPGIPMAPIPPAAAPSLDGGGPMGRRPFSGAAGSSGVNPAPAMEAVPAAPAPIARPTAPAAIGPTRSRMLDAAYRIMADANPYESSGGQDMYVSGLQDQSKMDESATERRQKLLDMGYQTDLGAFADAQSQDRSNTFAERRDASNRNFQSGESFKDRTFRAGQSALDRAQQMTVARFGASTQAALQASSQKFEAGENDKKWEQTKIIHKMDDDAKRSDRANAFNNTKAGRAQWEADAKAVAAASQTIGTLDALEAQAKRTRTGGALLGNAPGVVKWANKDMQIFDGMSNELALSKATDMKGSLSDKDVAFLQSMVPSIRKTRQANLDTIQRLRGIAQRQREYTLAKTDAIAQGEGLGFLHDWTSYTSSVPAGANTSFADWRTSRPTFDRYGNPVKK